ncbi:MAG: tRNA (guanosine(46)-N7)-methyltransferase TrmB [Candidatus Dasytiphilus stammeri]
MLNNLNYLKKDVTAEIRSFACRQGRLTKSQRCAINEHWQKIGIGYQNQIININSLFVNEAPLVIDIGFGIGDYLIEQAINNPQNNFIGIEVYLPGVGSCLSRANQAKLLNFRLIYHDAIDVFTEMLPDHSIYRVQLFFPDPWPKRRHHKRRLITLSFAKLVLSKLQLTGIFHIVTDWTSYAEHIIKVMNDISGYKNLSEEKNYMPRPFTRPLTKFEKRGISLGYIVRDIMYQKL